MLSHLTLFDTERMRQCGQGSRDWSDVATNQRMLGESSKDGVLHLQLL